MIKIDDQIIRWIHILSHLELKTYLILSRYFTEKDVVDWQKIVDLVSEKEITVAKILKSLQHQGLIKISTEIIPEKQQQEIGTGTPIFTVQIIDLVQDPGRPLQLRFKKPAYQENSEAKSHDNPIDIFSFGKNLSLYIKKKKRKKINKKKKKRKVLEPDSGLAFKGQTQVFRVDPDLHKNIKALIKELDERSRQRKSRQLVDYFSGELYNLTSISRSTQWRNSQLAIAKRLFKEHELVLDQWKSAVDFFISNDFWKDKINSLLQIEKHLNQWAYFQKQRSKSSKITSKFKTL